MPSITIQSLELTEEQKKTIAKEFSAIFSEVTKVPEDKIFIFFDGYKLEDAACGQVLFSKNIPQNVVGKFNQETEE